jgi:hypothetical protein
VQVWRSWSITSWPRSSERASCCGWAASAPCRAAAAAASRPAAAQNGANALDQQSLRERLGDEVVGAHLQAEQFVDLLILGGQEDHRHVGFLAQTAQQFHPVHARHLDIEDRQMRWAGRRPSRAEAPSV